MKALAGPLPVFRLQVGEIRAQLIGGTPQGWARIAYMTEEGITIGDTTFSAWSPKSWELLKDLTKQIESDLEATLSNRQYQQWSESTEEEVVEEDNTNPFDRDVTDTWS